MSNNTAPETTTAVALSPRQERAIVARDNMETGGKPAPLVPQTFMEAQAFAAALAESPLMPADLRKSAANVLVVILSGVEMGLTPMQSIRLHHVIEGVPRLSSAGIGGIVLASKLCEYLRCTEHTETSVTWETKRVGEPPMSITWNEARAKKAQKWGTGTWAKYPANMLSARARKEVCEIVYPDLIAGLLSQEEAEDMASDKERAAPPVFAAPQGPPPGVPMPPAKEEPKTRKPRAATIDAKSTETPTPPPPSSAGVGASAESTSMLSPTPSASGTGASSPSLLALRNKYAEVDRFGQAVDPSFANPTAHVAALDQMPAAAKLDAAKAAVEAKRNPTVAPATPSDSPASTENGGDAPENFDDDFADEDAKYTLEKFYAWIGGIAPTTTKNELAIAAAPWVKWTGEAFKKDAPELVALRKKYAEVKAGLPE